MPLITFAGGYYHLKFTFIIYKAGAAICTGKNLTNICTRSNHLFNFFFNLATLQHFIAIIWIFNFFLGR